MPSPPSCNPTQFRYEDYFSNRIKQLTFTFPEDAVTSSGTPFWSAPKRFPRALSFEASEPSSLAFVMAAAILRAKTYGVARPHWATDPARVAKVVASIAVPEFAPKQVRGGHICKVLSVTWWENRFQSFCPVAQASDSKNMQEGSQGRLRECGVKERERGAKSGH